MNAIFECGICYKQYDHNEKKPISLPCGHTFCYECIRKTYKNGVVKCSYDSISHHVSPENLPVNYQLLTALPMRDTNPEVDEEEEETKEKKGHYKYCDVHPNKKVKFYCKNCRVMFCSKCILKHNEMRHEII